MQTKNIIINNAIGEKLGKLTDSDNKLLFQTISICLVRNIKPNLPTHLAEIYEELKEYNLAHNDELKKEIEARHEKK